MSIRLKLILSICIPMILGFAAVLYWDYQHSYFRATEFAQQRVAERASSTAAQLDEKLNSIKLTADTAAEFFDNRPTITEQQLGGLLFSLMRPGTWTSGAMVAFSPTYQRGQQVPQVAGVRRNPNPEPPPEPGQRPPGLRGGRNYENFEGMLDPRRPLGSWFTKPRDLKKGVWIDPVEIAIPNTEPNKLSAYCVPFNTATDTFGGVIAVSVSVSDLQHLRDEPPLMIRVRGMQGRRSTSQPTLASTTQPTENKTTSLVDGGYVIIDHHGNLISHPDGKQVTDFISQAEKFDPDLGQGIHKALKGEGDIVTINDLDHLISGYAANEEYVIAIEPIQSTGWVFLTAVPKSELLGPIQTVLLNRAFFLSLTMLAPLGIVAFVSRRFCKPIEKMAKRVQEISQGDLDVPPIEIQAHDEIGRLAGGFNSMTEQLRTHIAALTEQTAAREKVESELRIARQIQSDLLPSTFPPFPDRPEFDLHALNQPARHIAGDFFDFFFIDPDQLILVIADVSGKGIPAAMLMAVTRTIIRNYATAKLSPCEIIEHANKMLVADSDPGMFVTIFLAVYRPSTGELTYVNAGHPKGIVFNSQGDAEPKCDSTGPVVGVSDDGELGGFSEGKITLQPGEGIFLYTDGVTESWDGNTLYGQNRLITELQKHSAESCREISSRIAEAAEVYQNGRLADDLTILVLRRVY